MRRSVVSCGELAWDQVHEGPLRDRGIRNRKSGQRGHQLITLKVVLPAVEEPELVAFLETWRPKTQQDPRKEMLS
jgi:hypothetical protein